MQRICRTVYQRTEFYDKLDVNVTGIMIELKLKEVQGVPMC